MPRLLRRPGLSHCIAIMKYRFKLPERDIFWKIQSFGIEPYYVREKDGREVKAGKAIIRCVIYNHISDVSRRWAHEAATYIVDRLNAGREYEGPNVLHFNNPRSVEGYFNG